MNERSVPEDRLVSVYTCHNPAELPVIESLLIEAGIRYFIRGEFTQNLIGGGLTGGTNLVAGPLDVWVQASDGPNARDLLKASLVEERNSGEPAGRRASSL